MAPGAVVRFPGPAMRFDHSPTKSEGALARPQRLASERGHQGLLPEPLLAALLGDAEGTTVSVLEKLGIQREPLARAAELAMDRQPRVGGPGADARGTVYLGETLRQVLEGAEKAAERLKDEFVSVEHLLLSLAEPAHAGEAQRVLA